MINRVYLFISVVLLLAIPAEVMAQEDEYDYRHYKFYAESAEPLMILADSVEHRMDDSYGEDIISELGSRLSAVRYWRRGEAPATYTYRVDGITADYHTVRALRNADIAPNRYVGTLRDYSVATNAASGYAGHYLRGELSGRSYLAALSYTATLPISGGVPSRKDDWQAGVYARARTGRDIYVEGVYTNAVDLSLTLARSTRRSNLSITFISSFAERGLRQPSTEEAFTLTNNTLYNPSWGMQEGRVRNSRIIASLRPELFATWEWRLTASTRMRVAADVVYSMEGYSSLMWFGTITPAPDNYRYMPSYQSDDDARREVEAAWRRSDLRYTQIDWQSLYHTNMLQPDGEAAYVVERRCEDMARGSLHVGFESDYGVLHFDYGLRVDYRNSRNYKRLDDLLGASHLTDLDYFLVDDVTYGNMLQNNLQQPDRVVYEGDRYGYDYALIRRGLSLYGAAEWSNTHMLLTAGIEVSAQQSMRRGYFEKELFAGSGSYGRSAVVAVAPYRFNVGWRYRIDRHETSLGAVLGGESPAEEFLYLQPQYNNRIVDNPTLRHRFSADISYSYSAPRLRLMASAYLISTWRDIDIQHYYDDLAATYCDAVVSDIGRLNFGVELSAHLRYSRLFSSTFALTAGSYRYMGSPQVSLYADNDNRLIANSYAHMDECRAAAPALMGYADVAFRSAGGWSATLSAHYLGMRYVEASFVRRSERVLSYASSPEQRATLALQQRMPDAFTLDISVGKRFRFKGGNALYLRLSVQNILGSNHLSYGYEQNRIHRQTIEGRTVVTPFDNRFIYAYPRTFYLSVGFSL